MVQRHEKSRSNKEIIYWRLDKEGNIVHEVGLPDGSLIPYDEYISGPPVEPQITVYTPVHADSAPYLPLLLTGGLSAVVTILIIVLALH